MDQKPIILIVSSSNTQPKSIIKLIANTQNIAEDPLNKNKTAHPWFIDTKYYTAEVELVGINKNYNCTEEFYENVEALLIHFDSNKTSGLDDLEVWSCIEENCEAEIKLLITNYCNSDTKVPRTDAVKWCLDRGFELIELYPETVPEESSVIEEKIGVERVVEALQAHVWSNLIMKDNQIANKPKITTPKLSDNLELQEVFLDDDDDEEDDFADLFSKLAMMRDSLQSMPISERKKHAEEMVTAFWKAIGGDEEEIADI